MLELHSKDTNIDSINFKGYTHVDTLSSLKNMLSRNNKCNREFVKYTLTVSKVINKSYRALNDLG